MNTLLSEIYELVAGHQKFYIDEQSEKLEQLESALRSSLPPSVQDDFDRFIALSSAIDTREERFAFRDGLRIGLSLSADAYAYYDSWTDIP